MSVQVGVLPVFSSLLLSSLIHVTDSIHRYPSSLKGGLGFPPLRSGSQQAFEPCSRPPKILRLQGGSGLKYYDILGLPSGPDSSPEEIKKAYKKMALKWHPDRAKAADKDRAESMFKKVSEAYQVLSDPDKKSFYDRWGDDGMQEAQRARPDSDDMSDGFPHRPHGFGAHHGPAFDFTDPAEVFSRMFGSSFHPGMMGGMGGMRGMQGFAGPMGGGLGGGLFGSPVFQTPGGVHVMVGQPSGISMIAQIVSGLAEDFFARRRQQRAAPQTLELPLECTLEELLTGCTKKVKTPKGILDDELEVEVKPGWKEGTRITFVCRRAPESDAARQSAAADEEDEFSQIVLVLKELPHADFTREGHDLVLRCRISTQEAQQGTRVRLPMLGSAKKMVLPLKPSLRTRGKRRVKGKGMPMKGGCDRGDLVVHIQVTPWPQKALGAASDAAVALAKAGGARAWAAAKAQGVAGVEAVARLLGQSEVWHATKRRALQIAPQAVTFGVLLLLNPTYAFIHAGTLLLMHFGIVEFARRPGFRR